MRKMLIVGLAGLSMCAITACGGGEGGNGGHPDPGNGGGPGYTPGVFPPSAQFAARCQVPRTGNDPFGSPWPDQPGTALLEKHFLRSWTHEFYLWADEVPDRNPFHTGGSSGGVLQYFDLLKTTGSVQKVGDSAELSGKLLDIPDAWNTRGADDLHREAVEAL